MRDDDPGAGDGAVPKLTLAQRILTALPNLQRTSSPTTTGSDRSGRDRPAQGASQQGATRQGAPRQGTTKPGAPRQGTTKPGASKQGSPRASSATSDGAVQPDEVIESNGSGESPSGAATWAAATKGRAAAGSGGARPNPYADWGRADLEHGMKYLDDTERRFALIVGPLVAVLDVVLTIVTLHNNPPLHIHGHLNKAHANPSTIVALGIGSAVIACLVVVSALVRRRSLTIFALLFSGYGGGLLTMLPAWVMAGWLFVHFNRMQKALRAMGVGPRGRVPTKPGEAAAAGRASARQRSTARRDRKLPAPIGPGASKRYTPPKPTRPRPPAPS